MSHYILRRLVLMVPVILVVTAIVFLLVQMIPGDPAITYVGGETLDQAQLDAVRHHLGLDQPLPVQYVKWLYRAAHGDMGRSVASGQPVVAELRHRLPVTLQLAGFAVVIAVTIAFPAGMLSAVMRNRLPDTIASVVAMAGVAVPSFWLALLLIQLFSVRLGWLPPSGYASVFSDPALALKLTLMPALVMGSAMAANIMRQLRSSMLEVLRQDYVRTARAKGLGERAVLLRHVLRNTLLPVTTVMGLEIPRLVAGSLIIESIFGIPGMGQFAILSILKRDFLAVQAAVLVTAIITLTTNFVVDLCYAVIDPRIRYT